MDFGFSGPKYTWTNHRSWTRLDRILVNPAWLDHFPSSYVAHLPRVCCSFTQGLLRLLSCFIEIPPPTSSSPLPFRFQSAWTLHSSFLSFVKTWNIPMPHLDPITRFFFKLKHLKSALNGWKKNTFGNIFKNVRAAKEKVSTLQSYIESDPSNTTLNFDLKNVVSQLAIIHLQEAIYWRQKSRIKWLKEGGKITKFFHNTYKSNYVLLIIKRLKNSSYVWVDSPKDIKNIAIPHFTTVFSSDSSAHSDPEFLHFIPTSFSDAMNAYLLLPQIWLNCIKWCSPYLLTILLA